LWLKAGILFIHVPKAAGTSINEALFGRFMGHARGRDIDRWGSAKLKALPSFAITRNPWDRLVSAYRFAKRGRGVGGGVQAWIWKPEQYQTPEFASFDNFVRDWLAVRNVSDLDPVFQPQSQFVCDDSGRILVDHLGRLENIEPTLDFIHSHIGKRLFIERSNVSGGPIDYRNFYTPETMETVGRLYAEDVQRFGYEIPSLLTAGPSRT